MIELKPLLPDFLISGTIIRLTSSIMTKAIWSTILIGARQDRYLVVEMPSVNGARIKLDEGLNWSASFLSRGDFYNFNTEVLGATFRPVPLLTLSYPKEAEVSSLRQVKRYPVNIPVVSKVISWPNAFAQQTEFEDTSSSYFSPPEHPIKGLVVDISEGGCLMASSEPLAPEAVVESSFYLPQEAPLHGIRTAVRTCRGTDGRYFMGLAYISSSIPPESLSRLNELIVRIESIPLRL